MADGAGMDRSGESLAGAVPGRDSGDLLTAVVATIGESLDVWSVDLWTFSRDADTLVCRAYWCHDGAADGCLGAVVALDQSHDLRRLVLAAEAVERHVDDQLSPADAAALAQRGFTTRIDLPLLAGAEVLGVLSLAETRSVRRLSEPDRSRLQALARLAAVVLRTTELYEAESDRGRRLVALLDSGRGMASTLEVRELVAAVRGEAARLLPGAPCEADVVLRRDDGSYARVAVGGAGDRADAAGWRADALARQAVDLRRPEQDRTRDGRARLLLPLVAAGRSLGYLELTAQLERRYREHEVELAALLADQASVALANARAYRAVETRSATDTLTGVYSRWYFYERLYAEVARSRRYHQPLSLVVAELDGYDDLVIDRGVEIRDAVLVAIARLLVNSLRQKVDLACRLGGGRFGLLLPATPHGPVGAGLVAERVRRAVDETRLVDDDLGPLGRFTMSLGVAGYPGDADDADELAAAAEAMLGRALAGGGDRIEPPLPEPDEAAVEDRASDADGPEGMDRDADEEAGEGAHAPGGET